MEKIDLGKTHSLVQIRAPEAWRGKTLEQLSVRKKHKVNVVAIRRPRKGEKTDGETYLIDTPLPDSTIETGDMLLVVGTNEAIEALPKSSPS